MEVVHLPASDWVKVNKEISTTGMIIKITINALADRSSRKFCPIIFNNNNYNYNNNDNNKFNQLQFHL